MLQVISRNIKCIVYSDINTDMKLFMAICLCIMNFGNMSFFYVGMIGIYTWWNDIE